MFEGKLTQKQRRFAEAIFQGKSATDAYVVAGYKATKRTIAGVEGCKLLKKPNISAYLGYLKGQVEQEIKIDTVALISELTAIALTRINHLLNLETGEPLPLSQIPLDALASVAEFSVDEHSAEQMSKRKRRLKMHDKRSAIETLLKIEGYTSELNQALRTLEAYGVVLKQTETNEWVIEK